MEPNQNLSKENPQEEHKKVSQIDTNSIKDIKKLQSSIDFKNALTENNQRFLKLFQSLRSIPIKNLKTIDAQEKSTNKIKLLQEELIKVIEPYRSLNFNHLLNRKAENLEFAQKLEIMENELKNKLNKLTMIESEINIRTQNILSKQQEIIEFCRKIKSDNISILSHKITYIHEEQIKIKESFRLTLKDLASQNRVLINEILEESNKINSEISIQDMLKNYDNPSTFKDDIRSLRHDFNISSKEYLNRFKILKNDIIKDIKLFFSELRSYSIINGSVLNENLKELHNLIN